MKNSLNLAKEMRIADLVTDNPEEALADANIIILATPVRVIIQYLKELPQMISHGAIVIDIGSTKSQVTEVMESLPRRFDPIGGHPMCGKEKLSLSNADPDIFYEAPFALVRLKRTSEVAVTFAEQLCKLLGAQTVWIDAKTHDRWTAATSHLPFLVANALIQALPEEAAALIGPGFISTTRLAATPASMMMDILRTNRIDIIKAIDRLQDNLSEYRQYLDLEDYDKMASTLAEIENKQIVNLKVMKGRTLQ